MPPKNIRTIKASLEMALNDLAIIVRCIKHAHENVGEYFGNNNHINFWQEWDAERLISNMERVLEQLIRLSRLSRQLVTMFSPPLPTQKKIVEYCQTAEDLLDSYNDLRDRLFGIGRDSILPVSSVQGIYFRDLYYSVKLGETAQSNYQVIDGVVAEGDYIEFIPIEKTYQGLENLQLAIGKIHQDMGLSSKIFACIQGAYHSVSITHDTSCDYNTFFEQLLPFMTDACKAKADDIIRGHANAPCYA
jgi:hypothetical protein